MDNSRPSFATLALKTIVVHTVTYFVCGILAFYFFDYAHKFAEPGVRDVMRQTNEPIVMAGPLFQPIRGLLFAIAFYPIRAAIFGRKHGWLALWLLLPSHVRTNNYLPAVRQRGDRTVHRRDDTADLRRPAPDRYRYG